MASNTSIVIYKHDISGVALFASTAVLAYASTSLIVDKLVKRYFPSTSDYNAFFMKTALTGTVLRSYAIRPNETWAGVMPFLFALPSLMC